MSADYGFLVRKACVILDEFKSEKQSLDYFLEDKAKEMQGMSVLEREFIVGVVSGCIEHKRLLEVVISGFYVENKTWLLRKDQSQFAIICYLATFALDELGLQNFMKIVKSLGIKKMQFFLKFFFSNLTSWIQESWNSIYEAEFVEKQWIHPLLRWRPEIEDLFDQFDTKLTQGTPVKKAQMKTTQAKEFFFTPPKPKAQPVPELPPMQEKHKPVPCSTYAAPKEIQKMEEMKEKNSQRAKELLYEANLKPFRCGNPEKSEHTKRLIAQIEEDMESKLKFNSFHSSGLPPFYKEKSCSVRQNNAAILKREALHDRQMQKEIHRIEQLNKGALEPSSFLQWQREMADRDLKEKLPMMEQKRLETLVSKENVALLRKHNVEQNQKAAQLKKEETAQLMQSYAKKRLQEEKELRDLVQQVAEGHKNSRIAKEKLMKLKQEIVREVSEQNQELLRQALEEQQEELCRKFEMILEIRAIESVPRIWLNMFDETETAGHELLIEMSLAELKQRLAFLKQAQEAEREERRGCILEEKQKKKEEMMEKLDKIDRHQRVLAKAAACRKEEKKVRLEFFRQVVAQDETVLALKQELEEKKLERQKLKLIEQRKRKPQTNDILNHRPKQKSLMNKS